MVSESASTVSVQAKKGFFGVEEYCLHQRTGCGCFGPPERITVNFVCGLCLKRYEDDHHHDVSNRRIIIGNYRESDGVPEFIDVCLAQMVGALMFDSFFCKFTCDLNV